MVLVKIFPVVFMVLLGLFCRKCSIISSEGIGGLKTLATNFMLPVLLFHTLATTTYSSRTVIIIGVMLLQLSLSFALGFLFKKLVPSLGDFIPFVVSSFEGGMLGYPLYTVLCGEEHLANIATIDIANTMFVFTIFLAFLMSTASGNFDKKAMVSNVLHSPVFWGVFLGILVGVSGIAAPFLATLPGEIYLATEQLLTSALTAVILIVVGYGLSLEKSVLAACSKAVLSRLIIQAVLLAVTLFLLRDILTSVPAKAALILYSALPPTFVVPVYAKTERDSMYLSTTISIYSVITIAVFVGMTVFMA